MVWVHYQNLWILGMGFWVWNPNPKPKHGCEFMTGTKLINKLMLKFRIHLDEIFTLKAYKNVRHEKLAQTLITGNSSPRTINTSRWPLWFVGFASAVGYKKSRAFVSKQASTSLRSLRPNCINSTSTCESPKKLTTSHGSWQNLKVFTFFFC